MIFKNTIKFPLRVNLDSNNYKICLIKILLLNWINKFLNMNSKNR